MATTIDLASDFDSPDAMIAALKKLFAQIQPRFPGLVFGYTGDVGIQADENAAMASDMTLPAILAYGVILVLFLFSFNQIRAVAFAMISLVLGILYNYGIVGITIGEINLVTSIGTALLIGMGIDYGIQVTTNFTSFRGDGHSPEDAIRLTFSRSGRGIILAAATTSASFFVLLISSSKAIAQLGLVAGAGILTCMLSMILVLPSLLLWLGKRDGGAARLPQIDYRFLEAAGIWAARFRVPVLVVSALAAGGLFYAALSLKAEYNILEFEPQKAPSIQTHRRIMDKLSINPMSAAVMASDFDEARALTKKLESLRMVGEVQSIAPSFPRIRSRPSASPRLRSCAPRSRRLPRRSQ
ncbi:MAG: MMPL family transporter [Candidatus Competibacteraceae bacterium]|nr:MMPL family transporter [Candidatus Competibacteraceae bacterium]